MQMKLRTGAGLSRWRLASLRDGNPAREEGNASLIAIGLLLLLLALFALTFDMGTLYVGQGQLQTVADASARAALARVQKPDPAASGTARQQATAAAVEIARRSSVIQGGIDGDNIRVEFGRFDFNARTFSTNLGDSVTPSAVRVTASRNSFQTMTAGQNMSLAISSVAARRCRNIILATDVSTSFDESIGIVRAALEQIVLRLEASLAPDKVALVAFRNIVVTRNRLGLPVTSPSLVPASEFLASGQLRRLEDSDVSCSESRDIPRAVPGCAGTNLAAAFDAARDLFLREASSPSGGSCENMLVILSDGVPCKIDGALLEAEVRRFGLFGNLDFPLIGDPNRTQSAERRGGGSTRAEATAARNELIRQTGASVATIALDTARENSDNEICLLQPGQTTTGNPADRVVSLNPSVIVAVGDGPEVELMASASAQDEAFLADMVFGFGASFEPGMIERDKLARALDDALAAIPPVTVDTTPVAAAGL